MKIVEFVRDELLPLVCEHPDHVAVLQAGLVDPLLRTVYRPQEILSAALVRECHMKMEQLPSAPPSAERPRRNARG
jgi:hypothetical protein